LQAVDAFRIFRSTIDALEVVFPAPPVVLNGVNVFNDGRIEPTVKVVRGMVLARFRLEQILDPTSSFCQTSPEQICLNFSLDQFLPKHSLGNHTEPTDANKLGSTK
jgi:hypothetical protein